MNFLIALLRRVSLLLLLFCFYPQAHAWDFWTPGDTVDNVGYRPRQPMEFSHKKHVSMGVQCEYCHSSARRSFSAGIPSTNTCMGCHKYVATDKEPIKYLTEKYEKNEPIEWVKVHDLPDFVRFPHKRHVQAKVDCTECHGNVGEMTVAEQVAPLQMGWCIDCHKERKAPINCFTCHY